MNTELQTTSLLHTFVGCVCRLAGRKEEAPKVAISDQPFFLPYVLPHRAYHNTEHILTMLRTAGDLVRGKVSHQEDRDMLTLAILFHDVVYEPGNYWNEEASVHYMYDVMKKCSGLGVPVPSEDQLAYVAKLIRETQHQGAPDPDDLCGAIIRDADLWQLSLAPWMYSEVQAKVFQEFASAPMTEWIQGRIDFLNTFLDRDRIFFTEAGQEREERARKNMQQELDCIQLGTLGQNRIVHAYLKAAR